VTSWAALQRVVHDYGHCDKGPAKDLFTEAVLRVVISGWPKVGDAGRFSRRTRPSRPGWTGG